MLFACILGVVLFSFVVSALGIEAAIRPYPRKRASDTAALAYSSAHAVNGNARQVTIRGADGAVLKAWYLTPPQWNGKTVIACHGVADSGFGAMGDALLFLRNGYAALVPDSRGHGESSGLVTYGVLESEDIVRWEQWLESLHSTAVYGFGESLGGAILLESLAKGAQFHAIIAESAYASFTQVAEERVVKYGRVPGWLADVLVHEGEMYVRLRYHVNLDDAQPAQAVRSAWVPILLIHGLEDRETYPIHSKEIYRNASNAQLWLVPNAKHTGAYGADPREFEARSLNFFANAP